MKAQKNFTTKCTELCNLYINQWLLLPKKGIILYCYCGKALMTVVNITPKFCCGSALYNHLQLTFCVLLSGNSVHLL